MPYLSTAKMATEARVVCWKNREEWVYVYRALYNFDDPEIQRKGVDRVAAWKSRSAGKLPLAIECTSNLVSSRLALNNVVDEIQGRLTLAMAIVRFVNGMVDQVQKGKFARSVQSIAGEIGLPDWLVDLRHEATHASLPSMETLQNGLHVGLHWLQEEYWEAQIKTQEESEQKLSRLLNEYRDVALICASMKQMKGKNSSKMKELSDEIASIVSTSNLWSPLLSILSSKEMMVPSIEQLNTLGIKWPLEDSSSDFFISDVPREILKIWKTLLMSVDKSSTEFIFLLIIHLLEELSDVHSNPTQRSFCHFLAAWVKHLLQEQSDINPSLLTKSGFSWVSILQVTLDNPSVYSSEIISLILKNLPMVSTGLKEKIKHLVAVFVNLECSQSDTIVDESLSFDLEQWIKERQNISATLNPNEPQEDDTHVGVEWQISKALTQWHLIPLGEVVGTRDMSPCNLLLSQPSGDVPTAVNGLECQSTLENTNPVAGCSDDAIFIDTTVNVTVSGANDETSRVHNSELHPSASFQERGAFELVYVDNDQELPETSFSGAFEREEDTNSISEHIYLF